MLKNARKIEEMSGIEEPVQNSAEPAKENRRRKEKKTIELKKRPVRLNRTGRFT